MLIQVTPALSYIEANHTQVEVEYQEVLQTREEICQYWEERNREHFVRITTMPRQLGQEALWTNSGSSGRSFLASKSGSMTGTCKASWVARVNVLLPAPLEPAIMVRVGFGAVIAKERFKG